MQTYKVIVKDWGDILWYNKKKKLHRLDGPAVELPDGTKAWYQNGKQHRTDGPACEYPNGFKSWYQNGKLHRTDGPAVEHANGDKLWFIEGKQYTEEEFNKKINPKPEAGKKIIVDGVEYILT